MQARNSDNQFMVFAKPVGALCNLCCSYCYYHDNHVLYTGESIAKMPDDVLEMYIIQHLEATKDEYTIFSWHGGEPSLAGIDFYRKVIDFQRKNNTKGIRIINGIQTNGIAIDDHWCRFLAEHHFLVGISIDGPAPIHNRNRLQVSGKTTFKKVIKAYELLLKYGITAEILCVVNASNVNFPGEIYDFFKFLKAPFISFLPLVEKDINSLSGVSPASVPASAFGDFLIHIFDQWLENDIGKLKIQLFEETFRTAFKQDHTLCIFKKTCGRVPALERNGNLYSCDHYVNSEYLLGNIQNIHLADLLNSQKQKLFGQAKYTGLPKYCLTCEYLENCHGECPKNRFIIAPTGEQGLNYLCEGYKKFFKHSKPFTETIASVWNFQRQNGNH